MKFSCRWCFDEAGVSGLSQLLDSRQIEHGSAEQAINRVFLPRLCLNEQRPILVRLHLVAGDILLPEFIRALGVLDNELAVHDGPDQRIGRAYFADACRVAAET